MGGSAGGGAGSTAGVFGVSPKLGAAYAGTLTVAVGIATSAPATTIFLMCLRTPDDIAQVIDRSLHRAPIILCRLSIDRLNVHRDVVTVHLPRPSCRAERDLARLLIENATADAMYKKCTEHNDARRG